MKKRRPERAPRGPSRRSEAAPARPASAAAKGPAPRTASTRGFDAERAAGALLGVLVALAFLRLALGFVPSMWAWGVNLQRFLPPIPGWALWGISALALIPPVARRLEPFSSRLGDGIARHPGRAATAGALAAGSLAALLPDRTYLVGDFMIRLGSAQRMLKAELLFPQALPLDVFLHSRLPILLAGKFHVDPLITARALGVCEAATLGAIAMLFARGLGLAGTAALASGSIALFGGFLGMFTGYPKAFAEICLLTAATGLFATRVAREGRGLLPLGIVAALGFFLHRSALAFLLPVVLAWAVMSLGPRPAGRWATPAALLGAVVPLVSLGLMAPRILDAMRRFDTSHFLPGAGGPLEALAAGWDLLHVADLVNLILLLSPLALALPLMARATGPLWRRREALVLAVLALPFVAAILLVHPHQGVFRDWDDFAAGGVALSLLAAWLVGETLRAAPARAWVGVGAVLAAVVPATQWLMHNADADLGMARVKALLVESPARSNLEQALTWDYLGIRNMTARRTVEAAEALRRAGTMLPNPRILYFWGTAEADLGNFAEARELFRRTTEALPDLIQAWLGLAVSSYKVGDSMGARRAAVQALGLDPKNPVALGVLDALDEDEAKRAAPAR